MSATLTIHVDEDTWDDIREQVAADGGALLPGPPGHVAELFAPVEVQFLLDGKPLTTITGQLVHHAPRGDLALTFDDDNRRRIARATGRRGGGDAGTTNAPLWKRYQEMSRAEKLKLARQGNMDERRMVLKDRDASLHVHVLNNPGMTPKELAQLIRAGGVSVAFLQKVCERTELLGNAGVASALVGNPATPTNIAVRLVQRIPLEHARRIAKSTNYKQAVVTAARKRVIKR